MNRAEAKQFLTNTIKELGLTLPWRFEALSDCYEFERDALTKILINERVCFILSKELVQYVPDKIKHYLAECFERAK